MPRDIAVRLIVTGSQQAREVLNNFSRDLKTLEAQGNALNKAGVAKQGELLPISGLGQGTNFGPLRQELRATADTFKLINTATIDFGGDLGRLEVKTVDYTGSVKAVLQAQKDFAAALEISDAKGAQAGQRIATLTAQYEALIAVQNRAAASAQQRIGIANERITAADTAIATAAGNRDASARTLENLYTRRASGELPVVGGNLIAAAEADLAEKNKILADVVATETKARSAAQGRLAKAEADLTAATQEAATLQTQLARRTGGIQGAAIRDRNAVIAANEANIAAAYQAPSPIPSSIAHIQQTSPALLRRLQQAGLGGGAAYNTPEFVSNLQNQGAYDSVKIQGDLVRQVTRVTGSFVDQNKVLQSFSAEYDKSGRVITRFGSNLSGLGNVLNQLGRDFQKVIEFAIATTAVFGSFQYAIKELSTIKELDKSIRQLSVTAGLTRPQAVGLFQDIADIAIATATPLTDLVKATDDIALATRRAGQTTSEWRTEILSLTQSVGILTNLAGIDTVEATDQLVATMKQLNLQATDLPAILNKVTAVAGGQSAAIADVVKGLGVLAEAGQQANLTIDQMIATVQTLSQVTSKSPAEVATALKQLIGALGGPAGTKALAQYNIALRDGAGNLRNIIDIYSEIADKIQKGVIPQADVQGLVRAIAGGPRRAPDAAALLSSIGDIADVTQKSIGATNEALIANAKILDTAQAKFTQLQAAIDKFATTKFADVLNQAAGSLASVLGKVLDILGALPTGAYLAVIQFGLLAAAVKFAVSVGTYFVGTLGNIAIGLRNLTASLGTATIAQREFNASGQQGPVAPTRLGRISGQIQGGRLLGAGALGAAAAATTAASGGTGQQIAGAGLQTAGFVLLAVPEPTLVTKGLGLAALAAGTALQFFGGEAKKAGEAVQASNEDVLNAVSAYKTMKQGTDTLSEAQATLGTSIDTLQATKNRTAEQDQRLISLQNDYAENSVKLISANLALKDSFENLNSVLAVSPYAHYAQTGVYSTEDLKRITQQVAPKILEQTNPAFIAPENFALPSFSGSKTFPEGYIPPPIPSPLGAEGRGVVKTTADLKNLYGNADKVREVITQINSLDFSPNDKNLELIDVALQSIRKDIPLDEFKALSVTFQEFAAQNNSLYAASRALAIYKAYLTAGGSTGLYTPDEVKNGNAVLDITQKLIDLIPQAEARNLGPDFRAGERGDTSPTTRQRLLEQAKQFAFDSQGNVRQDITKREALDFGRSILDASGQLGNLEKRGAVVKTIALLFKDAGLEVRGLTDDVKLLGAAADENLVKFMEGLDQLKTDTTSNAASSLANLQAQLQSGDFKGHEDVYRRNVAQQNALITTTNNVVDALEKEVDAGINVDGVLRTIAPSLSNINGLQDAATLSGDQLIARMFSLAEVYGLTGDQVVELGLKMAGLLDVIDKISKIRATLNISANVDLSGLITMVRGLKNITDLQNTMAGHPGASNPYDAQLIALLDAQKTINGFASDVGSLLGKGNPTQFKVPSKASSASKNGPDISSIDIPEEIAKSTNFSALLQEAIRRARELQAKFPKEYRAEAKNDIVELLKGTQRVLEVRGVKDDLLRKALEELAAVEKAKLDFETKADSISRIRVGAGSFAGLVNVPLNSKTGVSVGGPNGPITVNLNINGQVLTPAQFAQLADQIGAAIKSQM